MNDDRALRRTPRLAAVSNGEPKSRPNDSAREAARPSDAPPKHAAPGSLGAETKTLRLSVLEDSYSSLRLMMRTFHQRGHHLDHFTNIDDALESLAQGNYDALIVSDTMAGGAEACQTAITRVRSRSDQATATIPILAVTPRADPSRFRVLEVLGATATLSDLTEARLVEAVFALIDDTHALAPPAPTAQPSILLVEDSYTLSLVLANALTQAHCPANHVTTAEQAVAALNEHDYTMVLLSQNDQPERMSAVQFIEYVRFARNIGSPPPRLWVLTDDPTPANAAALRRAGAEHVLSKRDPARLGKAVVALLHSASKKAASAARAIDPAPTAPAKDPSPPRARTAAKPVEKGRRVTAFKVVSFLALTTIAMIGGVYGWQMLFAATPVEVATVRRGTVELTAMTSGLVVSKRQVDLTPTQAGQLYKTYVNEGDLVRKGEALATLDNREATVNVRRAEAQVFRYRTELNLAEKALKAWRALSDAKKSPQIVLDAEASREMASVRLRVAEQELRAAQVTLDRLVISAPFAGAITRSLAIDGKWVEAGVPLFTLADMAEREVALRLPADVGQDLAAGLPVRMMLESTAEPQDGWQETVVRVVTTPESSAATRTSTTIYTTLGDDAPVLQIGQRVAARIVTDVAHDVVVAPFDALIVRNGQSFAAVVVDDRVSLRPVELGLQHEGDVEIRAGLRPSELVVISHIHLDDGQRITVARAGDAGAGAQAAPKDAGSDKPPQ